MTRLPRPRAGEPPAPGSTEHLDRLKALLREMFHLDRGDLDFGLYRIMNLKAAEVAKFLDHDLLPQVKTKLNLTTAEERALLEKQLEEAHKAASKLWIDPEVDTPPAITEMNRRLTEMKKDADAEADVYNHLASFFGRYYSDGDFVSQRRYSSGGRSAYLLPHDGEEVKLHWANAEQYYVKTTENYASYVFTVDVGGGKPRRVRFEIAAADNEKDNVKEANGRQRRFVLAGGGRAADVEGDDLVVRFAHRPLTDGEKKRWPGNGGSQQGRIDRTTTERVLAAAPPDWRVPLSASAPTGADGERTLLAKHVERYTAKNSFDYFIHKDLGGFLRRELDLYLNTDVLNFEDLDRGDAVRLDRALARVKAVRHVGRKLIDFLAQLEDFQKRLWLKKKFVLETHWCVTLDRVPEALHPEIALNAAQRAEWAALFAADEIAGDLTNGGAAWSDPPSPEFLEANPYLVVDTRHFDRRFTDRLLAALSDAGPLDEQTDGLLVHGENFQALSLLQARYRGQVKCVYIDPPYNTDATPILYKNDLKSSSYLSLLESRLRKTRDFLKPSDSALCVAIDDTELANLSKLLETVFPDYEIYRVVVNHYPGSGTGRRNVTPTHEYALFVIPKGTDIVRGKARPDGIRERNFRRSGTGENNYRTGRPNSFYAIVIDPVDFGIVGIEEPPAPGANYPTDKTADGNIRVYPIGKDGAERVWTLSYEQAKLAVEAGALVCTSNLTINRIYTDKDSRNLLKSVWMDKKYNAVTNGTNLLASILGHSDLFPFPKSLFTVQTAIDSAVYNGDESVRVLDYFAGSGTTAQAVVSLNRSDGRQRKYTLVEIGDHFNTALLPRLKKIIHSPDWKDGKPISRKGLTQLFQYVRLESYEDTMDGLVVTPPSDERNALLAKYPEMAEDYRLRYALGVETSGSASLLGKEFRDPFAYTLSVVRDGARRETPVDLPETFNYLIGLRVESRCRIDDVLAITGTDAENRKCLILWRNVDATDHAALDAWFDRHRERFAGSLDRIWVNGDHTLNAHAEDGDTWTAETIEPVFRELMFGESEETSNV